MDVGKLGSSVAVQIPAGRATVVLDRTNLASIVAVADTPILAYDLSMTNRGNFKLQSKR